uniref:Ovule protein n=1 Tax=Haemonchus placei TaxID=6290 RepID=A0A0N4W1D3_HAEPC
LFVLILLTSSTGFPLFNSFLLSKDVGTAATTVIHHRHKHHHQEAKIRRNKHLLLTKPYWPWP